MELPAESGGWEVASIVWIETKGAVGQKTVEVIYELRDEPDVLRQFELREDDVYSGARRGDAILVRLSAPAIRELARSPA